MPGRATLGGRWTAERGRTPGRAPTDWSPRAGGVGRGLEDLEFATLEWVAWFNTCRLLEPLDHVPPAEYEEQFYRAQAAPAELVALK